MFGNIKQQFNTVRDEARDFLRDKHLRPNFLYGLRSVGDYFANMPRVARLIAREPEILLFAAAQWIVIWLAYLAWTQMLYWIPDSVWHSIEADVAQNRKPIGMGLVDLALLGWSFVIVVVASFPIGVCSAAMVAVHNLRNAGQISTIGSALALAELHLGRIWTFSIVDSWVTVNAIFDRLPKKNSHRKPGAELLYYAWKLGTLGVVPALVTGRGYLDAGHDSMKLLTTQPGRALGLRLGYSAVCWIVGIGTYVAVVVLAPRRLHDLNAAHAIFDIYFWAASPIFVAVGIVCVLVRPFFLLAVATFYTEVFDVTTTTARNAANVSPIERRGLSWLTFLFFALSLAVAAAVSFPHGIGLSDFIARLAPSAGS
jgi:hypothetical protein